MENIALANTALLLGSVLVLVGILSSLVATRFGAPLLLVFLVLGMLAGEDGPGGVKFNDYQLTYIIGSLALAVILFDGGLRTKISVLRGAVWPAISLATFGVLITAGLTGIVASYLFDLPALQGFLVGAVVCSTDAAAVFFLIHAGGLQLRRRVGATLEMESATNDPVAVFLTVMVVQMIQAAPIDFVDQGFTVVKTLAVEASVGALVGIIGGLAASWLLNRITLPGGLHPVLIIALTITVYSLTVELHGSGFLAVYLAGLVLGNRPLRASASIVTVNDAATWLAQIVMFMVLGLLVTPSRLIDFALPAGLIAVFLMLVGRPVAVWLCLTPFKFSPKEKILASWVGLRGAVSIFLAAIPTLSNVPHAELYFDVAFVVVLISLLVQGWTLTWAASKLDLALPRTGAPIHRSELDLPGQSALEMVGYPVRAESAVVNGAAVPPWARAAFVVRREGILTPSQAGRLQAEDYAYYLAPTDRVERLDQIFAPHAELLASNEPFFGEFSFKGTITLKEVAGFYDIGLDPALMSWTIAELFATRFENKPEVGDHLRLGTAEIIAREVEDDRVISAGLQLDVTSAAAKPTLVGRVLQKLLKTN